MEWRALPLPDKPVHKPAAVDHDIHPLIRNRWSPRGFDGSSIKDEVLLSILEAARWAPSSFNEQPWRFGIAKRDDQATFSAYFACLTPANQPWAHRAGVLLVGAAKRLRDRDGLENQYYQHDLGAALGYACLQASASGLAMHLLGGFDRAMIASACGLPEDFLPVTMAAIGLPDGGEQLPEHLRTRELAPRSRHPVTDISFNGTWGTKLS